MGHLALKEVYLQRWTIVGGTLGALLAAVVASQGTMGFNIGALAWLTAIIAVGAILVMYGVLTERKEKTLLFALGLPISPAGYVCSKLLGLGLGFVLCWAPASVAVVALVVIDPDISYGILPFLVLLCVYLLTNFAVLLAWVLTTTSEAGATAGVIITNMSVSVFLFTVVYVPGIGNPFTAQHPNWSPGFWTVLAVELLVAALALLLPLFTVRRRDFV